MPQADPSDFIALVRRAVQNDSTARANLGGVSLTTKVGGRVIPADLVDADASTIDLPVIVLDLIDGGSAEFHGGIQRLVLHVYAYSKVKGDAYALYDAFWNILQAERLFDPSGAITLAGMMRETERPTPGYNEVVKASFARGTWVAMLGG